MVLSVANGTELEAWKLPTGWEWVPLEELCNINIGGTPKRDQPEYWGAGHTWVSISDLNGGTINVSKEEITDLGVANSNAKWVEPGTILMSFKLTIGKLGIAGKGLYTNEAIAALPIKDEWQDRFNRDFLFQALKVIPLAGGADLAVKGKTLNKKKIAKIIIPIPFPSNPKRSLDIQRRIVARIEALMAEVRSSHELLDEMRRDCDQVIETSLSEVIKNLDKKYPNSPTIEELIRDEKIKMKGGGTPSRSNASYWMGTIPWVSPKDMKSWYISDAQEHISDIALLESSVKLIPIGSILTVVRGMILIHTFPVAVTQAQVTINQDMKAFEPSDDFVPEYLGYILRARSPEILQKVEMAGHGTRRLKTETLNQVVIPLLDKNHQRKIVEYLNNIQSEVNRMLELMNQDAKTLDLLEQSILERAFRGEL